MLKVLGFRSVYYTSRLRLLFVFKFLGVAGTLGGCMSCEVFFRVPEANGKRNPHDFVLFVAMACIFMTYRYSAHSDLFLHAIVIDSTK